MRKALAAMAAFMLCVTAAGPAIARSTPAAVHAAGAPVAAIPVAVDKPAAVEAAFSPTDETRVPHYFGPYANWAYTPQVLPDAIVRITPVAGGPGSGAEATATVDPKTGGISAITVTSPGSGYTAMPTVSITAATVTPTTRAMAVAMISAGVISSITVDEPGFGFTAPTVFLTGGTPMPGFEATALASGGVDDVVLTGGGAGYQSQPFVEFTLPDLPGGTQATGSATMVNGVVTGISVVNPGAGYASAPMVTIHDGPYPYGPGEGTATAEATIGIGKIDVTSGGRGYLSAPVVTIRDVGGVDRDASATAKVAVKGAVTSIVVKIRGAGYLTPGIKKFVDTLPGLTPTGANSYGQYIPVAVSDTTTYPGSDYYEIAVVQYRQRFSSQLPPTLLRGYVQLSTSVVPGKHVPLSNASFSGPDTPVLLPDGSRAYGVDAPHYLGPVVTATKDRPTRILFRNLLPTGVAGDLFLPVDTSLMGSGMGPDMVQLDANNVPIHEPDSGVVTDVVRNPECALVPKPMGCFAENRADLHLHGGITPWISDGTPHQWITPAGEDTSYPVGVSVSNVPDMPDPGPGAMTFFYTNQQSARLMWIHDHAWGVTRLNVYAGEASAYLLTDATEQKLISDGLIPSDQIPLIVQDKTFVSKSVGSLDPAVKLTSTDPTWQADQWGGEGSLWVPHVYMPAQNPGDPTGVNPYGRWIYGPWFWPPAKDAVYPPIQNPYYDAACDPDVQVFCEPSLIPSTPNVSVGMEAFNDTPLVNGTIYPKTTVQPKAYRFRILNAANDRFWNLQWYVADPRTGTLSEVALKASEVAAALTDPNVVPTPDTTYSPAGPNWIQIGTEGGFLPAPVVVPNQPITWITDPTRFDVGNADKHSLLLANAERADVIVDFSQFRGKTLILYNDAPAAFPARVSKYDYYTGDSDQSSSGGAPTTLPGYGPNTRTIMQVTVTMDPPGPVFDRPNTSDDGLGRLQAAFAHHADGSGVFESGSDPIIVGQAAYNSAYGTSFVASGWCNSPSRPSAKCDGYARIQEGSQPTDLFKFDTLAGPQLAIPFQPKGLHDEANSASFDEWGRMTANLGLEAPGATPILQNIILYPYVNPATEILDSSGMPSSLHVTPIATSSDGTQIWKITHNGVDTHPIHWHLYNVQVLNRVTWDNIIIPPDATELGWKETVRVSPLEDTIVAVRPIVPTIPFGVPDSSRPLNPMMPLGARGSVNGPVGSEAGFNNTDTLGNPINPIVNAIVNFGWEYVYHCHILGHEEMDMMRPVTVFVPRAKPDAPVLTFRRGSVILEWTDGTPVDYSDPETWGSPQNEVGYDIERAEVVGSNTGPFVEIGTALANVTTFTDATAGPTTAYKYRVNAWNAAGDSWSNVVFVDGLPAAPTGLTAEVDPAPLAPSGVQVDLDWVNHATNATNVVVERAAGAGAFSVLVTLPPTATNYADATVLPGRYSYRVYAVNAVGPSAYAGPIDAVVPGPGSGTTTEVVSSLDPSYVGDPVTFMATVAPVLGTGTPTGTVTFKIAGATTVATLSGGTAAFTTSTLPAGTHALTADYSGDATYGSSSDLSSQTVNKRASTTAVTSSLEPSRETLSVTFTATVRPASATGTIQFRIDGADVGAAQAVVGGQATYTTTTLTIGSHVVIASYGGDGALLASTSPSITQTVLPPLRASVTVVTSNGNPATFGQTVTFSARVGPATGAGIPTGTVQFSLDGAAVGGPVTLGGTGLATYATAALAAGSHTVTAAYSGSTAFFPSTSTALTEVVNKAATTTVVTSNRNPSTYGQSVTLTARVTPIGTGTVQFLADGAALGSPVAVDATGRAILVTGAVAVGVHAISAAYSGDANLLASTSAAITQTVNVASTSTRVTSNRNPALRGTSVMLTATVVAVLPGAGVPTGTVQWIIDGIAVGVPVALDATGLARYFTTSLSVGRHTVVAVYSGSTGYNGSTSPGFAQTIN